MHNLSFGAIIQEAIVRGTIFLGGNCPGEAIIREKIFFGGNCPGDKSSRGNRPGAIVWTLIKMIVHFTKNDDLILLHFNMKKLIMFNFLHIKMMKIPFEMIRNHSLLPDIKLFQKKLELDSLPLV